MWYCISFPWLYNIICTSFLPSFTVFSKSFWFAEYSRIQDLLCFLVCWHSLNSHFFIHLFVDLTHKIIFPALFCECCGSQGFFCKNSSRWKNVAALKGCLRKFMVLSLPFSFSLSFSHTRTHVTCAQRCCD